MIRDVILFCGQSNMQGQSESLSESEPVPDALEYKFLDDSLVPLRNPVGEDVRYDGGRGRVFTESSDPRAWLADHVLGSSCYGHTNLVPAFARAYLQETKRPLVAVHAAKGSTEIADWLPETDGYRALVAKAKGAIRKTAEQDGASGRIFFVWLQGESDAIAARGKEYYKDRLRLLAKGLENDLGILRFGVIRVGAFTGDGRDAPILAAQDEICGEDPFFLMLSDRALSLSKDASMMNPAVQGHYSARGLELLGTEAGHALGVFAAKEV
jgi:hypothetical protein